jgi:hypothetical protein
VNTQLSSIMELRWLASFSATCMHAAEAIAHGRLIADLRLAEAITEPAQILRQSIVASGLPRAAFWRNLTGLSRATDGSQQLAERAILKTTGPSRSNVAGEIAAGIAGVEAAVRQSLPSLMEELSLRLRPMREQWEAHGPGILHSIGRWTDPRVAAGEAQVILVHPALGGGGSAHLPYNNVLIEAVLTDPEPRLPEFLRLGWLLSQLNLDLPIFSETIHAKRLPHVAELAMIPVALRAAEQLDLLQLSPETIDLALTTWQVVTPSDVDPVDVLWRWWTTYQDTRPRWDIAFTALDRMFG